MGETFRVLCRGEELTLEPPLTPPKELKYAFRFLKDLRFEDSEVEFLATSYVPGQMKDDFPVTDAKGVSVQLKGVRYPVKSVIPQTQEPPKPFGPVAPFSMSYPMWVQGVALALILAAVGGLIYWLWSKQKRRAMEKEILKLMSPLGSYQQFHKESRQLSRSVIFSNHVKWQPQQVADYLEDLNQSFRYFLLREFILPAHTMTRKALLKEISKKDGKYYRGYSEKLDSALREMDRAMKSKEKLQSKDCQQLTKICRQLVDQVRQVRQLHRRAK